MSYHADISVADMIRVMDTSDTTRKEQLLEMLEIDLEWRMHKVSAYEIFCDNFRFQMVRPEEYKF